MSVALPVLGKPREKPAKKTKKKRSQSVVGNHTREKTGDPVVRSGTSMEGKLEFSPTGIPWLDTMRSDMKTELQETRFAGERVGAHAAFISKFAPNLGGSNTATGETPAKPQRNTNTNLSPLRSKPSTKTRSVAGFGPGNPVNVPYTPSVNTTSHTAQSQTKQPMTLRDYQMLALACQRGGKGKTEASTYYKMGELCSSSPDTLRKAGKYFERYYNLCKRLKDAAGEAKALNCLGIAHQTAGDLNAALQYHEAHLEVADSSTLFIAHTNIGIVKGLLGDFEGAMETHKSAMQCAIRSGDKQAELLALANLGLVGKEQKDYNTAQLCMSRHLELAQVINDPDAQHDAYEQLALLQSEQHDWNSAHKYFNDARQLAARNAGTSPDALVRNDKLKCKLGITKASGEMESHFREIAEKMRVPTTA